MLIPRIVIRDESDWELIYGALGLRLNSLTAHVANLTNMHRRTGEIKYLNEADSAHKELTRLDEMMQHLFDLRHVKPEEPGDTIVSLFLMFGPEEKPE